MSRCEISQKGEVTNITTDKFRIVIGGDNIKVFRTGPIMNSKIFDSDKRSMKQVLQDVGLLKDKDSGIEYH